MLGDTQNLYNLKYEDISKAKDQQKLLKTLKRNANLTFSPATKSFDQQTLLLSSQHVL